jgi:hypothetical protein
MDVEESVSGFKIRGSWGEVVEHGERITRALKDIANGGEEVDEDALAEWDEWRPKADERLGEPTEAVNEWRESINYVARAADSATRKALRKVEGSVYENVMTQMSPYYFDNDLVSANLSRADAEAGEYVFEININDDDLKIRVSNKLADYETSVDRWHVDTPKETDVAEAVEGHAPPENGTTDGGSDPKQT